MTEKMEAYSGMKHFFWKQFIVSVILMLIPLFICSFMIANLGNRRINEEIDMQMRDQTYRASSLLRETFSSINDFNSDLLLNSDMEMLFFSNDQLSVIDERIKIEGVTSSLNKFISSSNNIDSIYIYDEETDFVLASSKVTNATSEKFSDFAWYETYINENKSIIIRETVILGQTREYVTYCKPMTGYGDSKSVIAYNINSNFLDTAINKTNGNFYVIDSKDNLICSDADVFELPAYIKQACDMYKSENYSTGLSCFDNKVYVSYVPAIDLYFISEKEIENAGYGFWKILMLSLLAAGIFSLLIAWIITNRFYSAIIRITRVLQYPEEEDVTQTNDSNDEISFITKHITMLAQKSNDFETAFAKGMAQMKEVQTAALQFQVTPHFLLNTLQLINALEIEAEKKDTDVVRIVTNLSEILRFILDSSTYFVSLSAEIEYIKLYLDIQKYKYCEKFNVIWDIPEGVQRLQTIKFLLQPIVENAIFHGISPFEGKGTLWIRAERIEETLFIYIENDGVLISEEKIVQLNSEHDNPSLRRSTNFGFANVRKRISVIYGEKYGCKIGIRNGRTSVCISMPAHLYNEENEDV